MQRPRRKVKIGDEEFRMVASPASTHCSAHAIKVNGTTLLRHAWTRNRRQTLGSPGNVTRRARRTTTSTTDATKVRAAISVSGGIVSTPSLMNAYDAPHNVASSPSNASSRS